MPRTYRQDYYEELERIAQELAPLQQAEERALRRLLDAPPGERQRLLEEYLTAVALTERGVAERRDFLENYEP